MLCVRHAQFSILLFLRSSNNHKVRTECVFSLRLILRMFLRMFLRILGIIIINILRMSWQLLVSEVEISSYRIKQTGQYQKCHPSSGWFIHVSVSMDRFSPILSLFYKKFIYLIFFTTSIHLFIHLFLHFILFYFT